ncbi:hypothetical protein [Antrihabitans sp. YC2-6]|uniref:hypothetical protein n=1 Tax=Antrihabitans sp. YC2-6 TaxID=2799498 RepID=UPI0018F6E873|nr:hypothetical protein [Antrihabitans sp. YC2-6]MBJ8348669.1 hypothetical protein [Antrihabitans sp. YC2-6]
MTILLVSPVRARPASLLSAWLTGVCVYPWGRVVPVRHDCVRPVRRVCTASGDDPLVVSRRRGPDQAAALVGSFDTPRDVPRLTVARLRSTWLTSVLTDLALGEVFAAAAIVSGKAFSDLSTYLPAAEIG